MSVSERGSGEDAPPQHAWAAALLDACKLEELRTRNSNVSNSSGDTGSSGDDSSSGGSGSSGDGGCHFTATPAATAKPTGTLQVGMTFGFAAACAAQRAYVCSKT